MAKKDTYYVWVDGEYRLLDLKTLIQLVKLKPIRPFIWSARLSTGLVGLTSCSTGNRGPKRQNEVLLAIGNMGLCKLINLGFITCPACKPETTDGFWSAVKDVVQRKHGIMSLNEFVDKTVLPFDTRRLGWEEIVPILRQWPNRLYVPRKLQEHELAELKLRIKRIGYGSPLVGYYDHDSAEKFTPYNLSFS